jgi:hypothetical protein
VHRIKIGQFIPHGALAIELLAKRRANTKLLVAAAA